MHTQGRFYLMQFLNAETQSCCLESMNTVKTCNHHYLLLKTYDTYVSFLLWQATENRHFLYQAIQDIVQE